MSEERTSGPFVVLVPSPPAWSPVALVGSAPGSVGRDGPGPLLRSGTSMPGPAARCGLLILEPTLFPALLDAADENAEQAHEAYRAQDAEQAQYSEPAHTENGDGGVVGNESAEFLFHPVHLRGKLR